METNTPAKENTMENRYRTALDQLPKSDGDITTGIMVDLNLQDMATEIDKLVIETAADARRMADKYLKLAKDIEEGYNGDDPAGCSLARDITLQTAALELRRNLFQQVHRSIKGKDRHAQFLKLLRK